MNDITLDQKIAYCLVAGTVIVGVCAVDNTMNGRIGTAVGQAMAAVLLTVVALTYDSNLVNKIFQKIEKYPRNREQTAENQELLIVEPLNEPDLSNAVLKHRSRWHELSKITPFRKH